MENEFIPYKQALALKELGFNEECFKIFIDDKLEFFTKGKLDNDKLRSKLMEIYEEKFKK